MKIRLTLDIDYTDGTISPDGAAECIEGALQYAISNGLLSGETAAEIEDYGYEFSLKCKKCETFIRLCDENSISEHMCEEQERE